MAPIVHVDGAASRKYTVLEIIAPDELGLLHRVSRAIAMQGCAIDLVLIATEGEKAIDVFHITKDAAKLTAEGERELRTDAGELVTDKHQVDFESLRNRFVIGDPDYAIRQIERYRDELGATEILCWMHVPGVSGKDAMRSVELFAREVMPAFARETASAT